MDVPVAPTLSVVTTPTDGVEVYFPILDANATSIIVWRTAGGETEAVAGALNATVAGDFVITDFGVPFGVVSSYVGEIFDASGASQTGLPSTVQVDSNDVVFSDPTDPEKSFIVSEFKLGSNSFSSIGGQRDRELVYVFGLSRPFAQDWGLKGLEDLPVSVITDTPEDALLLKDMLQSSQILIRTPPTPFVTLPRLLYASIQAPRHFPRDWVAGGYSITWTLVVDEVQPTSKAIIRPLITWDDWTDAFPPYDPEDPQPGQYLWEEVMAVGYAAGTWTDAVRNPPIA